MRTLIISDLHLGGNSATDVLRRADVREHLLAVAAQADRIVLLGDVLELRHGPMRLALAAARPFFQALGAAIQGGEIVLVAGNHDHALIDPWLASRGQEHEPPPLGVEQLIAPEQASEAYARIAGWCAPARVTVAYPGLWVRDDVCAMHGHFLDCHLTVPTLERLSVGAMSRVLGRHPSTFASVGDYEAAGAPVFAWRDAVARASRTGNALNGIAKRRARSTARRGALLAGFPLAIAALNRAGIGPLRATISRTELRRAGLSAMDEVAVRLGLSGSYVVFGHTHRTGPLPGDEHTEWTRASGVQLINTGNWTYSAVFLTPTPGESPYWPGGCVAVGDSGPPEVLRLLCDQTHAQLMRPLSPADA